MSNNELFDLTDRVAVVTGGGSGIGAAIARRFASEGARVVVTGRRREPIEDIATEVGGLAVVGDAADPAHAKQVIDATVAAFGGLDVVVANAGIDRPGSVVEVTDVDWHLTIDVNLTGPFLCTQQAFRLMKNQTPRGGRIINNGSISAVAPRPFSAPYTATKHAITGLTKAISLDGRAFGIACGQLDIGNTATDMTAKMTTGSLQANGTLMPEPTFDVKHVVDAVLYMSGLPLEANVQFMTVMATKMPFVGRG